MTEVLHHWTGARILKRCPSHKNLPVHEIMMGIWSLFPALTLNTNNQIRSNSKADVIRVLFRSNAQNIKVASSLVNTLSYMPALVPVAGFVILFVHCNFWPWPLTGENRRQHVNKDLFWHKVHTPRYQTRDFLHINSLKLALSSNTLYLLHI